MSLIVDASVVVKWFIDEVGSNPARAVVGSDLAAPDLILAETFSAVSKRVRRGEALSGQLERVIPALRHVIRDIEPSGDLIEPAARLSVDLKHPIYDCLYIALARSSASPLLTADERQFFAARKARVDARLL